MQGIPLLLKIPWVIFSGWDCGEEKEKKKITLVISISCYGIKTSEHSQN